MAIPIPALSDDDFGFVLGVRQTLLQGLVATNEAWVVKVNHWFGPRWLQFSGKILGALGVRRCDVTLPPFHPHRVRFERHFARAVEDRWVMTRPPQRLHRWQESHQNLRRTIRDVSRSATFIWYSGETKKNDRGSLMVYQVIGDDRSAWYAGFARDASGWRTTQRHASS